jgi:uncharacterized membrane protein YccC
MPAGVEVIEERSSKPAWWVAFWQTVIRYEPDKVTPWLAFRNALGITLPLIFGVATGSLPSSVIVCTGALNVCFSDNDDSYAHRARRMFSSCVLVAIAVFVGGMSGHHNWSAVLVAAGWAFAAGMMVSISAVAADLGVISLVTLVVFQASPVPWDFAAYSALLAFGGGLLQTMLSLALWPVRRYEPERRVLGELYLELSRAAKSSIQSSAAPPASGQITLAQNSLAALNRDHSVEAERYRLLLSQAERIRLSLLALAKLRSRMKREDEGRDEAAILDQCFPIYSRLLASIGNWLLTGESAKSSAECLKELNNLTTAMGESDGEAASTVAAMILDARHQMEALAGQLRSAVDLAAYTTPTGVEAFKQREARQPWGLRLQGTLATLRANLTLRSAACRHAVRLAVCIGIGDLLARGVDWRRSYWLPMTIAIVLKPDFTATFSRGVLRLAGTFAGLVLATGLFHLLPSAIAPEVGLIGVLAFAMRCFGPANYGIFVTALTAMVVLLLAATGVEPGDVIAPRGLNTLVGGMIALVAYWVWPTWERTQVSEMMARMLDAYRDYFQLVMNGYFQPEASRSEDMDRARLAGRLARSNLEASVDRLTAEPGASAESLRLINAMMASSHRMIHAMMGLEAGLFQSRPVPPREASRAFAKDVELTLYFLAAALRGSALARNDLPSLRDDHLAVVRSGDSLVERYALVNVETDRITNSVNTLAEQTLEWIAMRRPSGRKLIQ